MPKVSIVVPIYNVEQYLPKCLDSIIGQSLDDIEIICVNDGSTDNSLEILQRYQQTDARIQVISKANSGYGHTMNMGIDKACGEYIGIVESDDFIRKNMFGNLYRIAKKNNLDFVKADFYRFVSEGRRLKLQYNRICGTNKDFYNRLVKPREEKEAFSFILNTWSGIYKKEFLIKNQIRHNETPGASFQDNGFWFQTFAYADRGMFIDYPYYLNRRDNINSSVHDKAKVYCINIEYDYIYNLLDRNKDYKELLIDVYWQKRIDNYIFTLERIGDEHIQDYVYYINKEIYAGIEAGELEENMIALSQRKDVNMIMKHPDQYIERIKKRDDASNEENESHYIKKMILRGRGFWNVWKNNGMKYCFIRMADRIFLSSREGD